MYELRNYSQHSNIPVSRVNVQLDNMATGIPAASTTINLSKNELLNSGYKWKSLKGEIQKLEDRIDIMPLIECYIWILKKIAYSYLNIYEKDILECHQYILALNRVFDFPENCVPVILNIITTSCGRG